MYTCFELARVRPKLRHKALYVNKLSQNTHIQLSAFMRAAYYHNSCRHLMTNTLLGCRVLTTMRGVSEVIIAFEFDKVSACVFVLRPRPLRHICDVYDCLKQICTITKRPPFDLRTYEHTRVFRPSSFIAKIYAARAATKKIACNLTPKSFAKQFRRVRTRTASQFGPKKSDGHVLACARTRIPPDCAECITTNRAAGHPKTARVLCTRSTRSACMCSSVKHT